MSSQQSQNMEKPKVIPVFNKISIDLIGHEDDVYGVACSPNCQYIASAGEESLRIWDFEKEQQLMKYNSGQVYAVAFSPDGQFLVSAGWGQSGGIKIWNINDFHKNDPIFEFEGHSSIIYRIVFSQDSSLLLTGGADSTIRVWSMAERKEITRFKGSDYIIGVAITNDKKIVFGNCFDGQLYVWNIMKTNPILKQKSHIGGTGLDISINSTFLITSGDGLIKMWNLQNIFKSRSLKLIRQFKAHESTVLISADTSFLVSTCKDYTIKIWKIETGEEIQSFVVQSYTPQICLSKNMKIIAGAGKDSIIRVWKQF